jgi:hypothetical protein
MTINESLWVGRDWEFKDCLSNNAAISPRIEALAAGCAWRIDMFRRRLEFGTSLDSASASRTTRDRWVRPILQPSVLAGAQSPKC